MRIFSFKDEKVKEVGIERTKSNISFSLRAIYVESSGSFVRDFLLTRRKNIEEMMRQGVIATNSVGFAIAWSYLGVKPDVSNAVNKQLQSILPVADGTPTRVRGKMKRARRAKGAPKVTPGIESVLFMDISNTDDANAHSLVSWAVRTQHLLQAALPAWSKRKGEELASFDPTTKKMIELKIKERRPISFYS